MKISISNTLQKASEFFMGTSDIHLAATRITKELAALELPFAIVGAIGVGAYGHVRLTQDLDLLMRKEDLAKFKSEKLGLGWVEKFEGSKGIRDVVANVPIDILLTGDYPGDGLAKPISFPDPHAGVQRDKNGWPILSLSQVIELKLASGMTALDRPRDFDDVIQLIRINQLPKTFGNDLHPYVQETWTKYWDISQIKHGEY